MSMEQALKPCPTCGKPRHDYLLEERIERRAKQIGDSKRDPNWWNFKEEAEADLTRKALTSSDDDVEAVARALYLEDEVITNRGLADLPNDVREEIERDCPFETWEELRPSTQEGYRQRARAAIAALTAKKVIDNAQDS